MKPVSRVMGWKKVSKEKMQRENLLYARQRGILGPGALGG